jgi:hypothetical protein
LLALVAAFVLLPRRRIHMHGVDRTLGLVPGGAILSFALLQLCRDLRISRILSFRANVLARHVSASIVERRV